MTEMRELLQAFAKPAFWANCFLDDYAQDLPGVPANANADADDDDYDGHDSETGYDLGDGYVLEVETGYGCASLGLTYPGAAEKAELGWNDLAHWHPHVLRWSETDVVCRAVALDDPDAAYPGPHLALLGPFTPVCDEDEAAFAVPMLREAFAPLPLDDFQRRSFAATGDMRAALVRWERDEPTGWWYPDQGSSAEAEADGSGSDDGYRDDPDVKDYQSPELYSSRYPDDEPDFPFAALAALVDRARARCAALLEQPWATRPAVRTAAETFAGSPTPGHRASLADALQASGCEDRAVLGALAPDAGELRALVMAELLLGAEPGSLVRAHADKPTRLIRRYSGHAYIPMDAEQPGNEDFAIKARPHINAALRAVGLGSISNGPGRVGRGGGRSYYDLNLDLLDDWHTGLEVVREVLRKLGAPDGSRVAVSRRRETVEADLTQPLPRD